MFQIIKFTKYLRECGGVHWMYEVANQLKATTGEDNVSNWFLCQLNRVDLFKIMKKWFS